MTVHSWLRKLLDYRAFSPRPGRRPPRRPRRSRPWLEVLEDRVCPAQTLTVATLTDPTTAAANDGSLRGALMQNQQDGGGDTIIFASGLNGTINLNSTLTNFGEAVTIANPNGDNIAISGQGKTEDLDLTGGSGVVVSIGGQSSGGSGSLTFTGGMATNNGPYGNSDGGGIFNDAATTLTGVTISGNTAANSSPAAGALGGGLFNSRSASLTLNDSAVSGNSATGDSGTNADGGGLYNSGSASINGSTISGNAASGRYVQGGGIYNSVGGSLFLADSAVSGNSASAGAEAHGGGINTLGLLTATNDTVWNNNVTANGGSGSVASGGGISTGYGASTLINVTIGDNTASATGGNAAGGGIFQSGSATLNLVNTIVSDPNGPSGNPDVSGTLTNSQNDDFASTAGLTISNDLRGNLLNVAPLLGTLADNGGPTETVAELSGSPTIDAGTSNAGVNAVFGTNPIPSTDQRGDPRPDGPSTNPDIGAFEFQSLSPTFSGLSSPTISYGTATVSLTGKLSANGLSPPAGEDVSITVNGVTQTGTLDDNGDFSINFDTATLGVAGSPYTITYRGFAATKGGIDKGVPLAEDGLR
jgi:hypothetical protein